MDEIEVVIKISKKCKKFLDNGGKIDWLDAIPIIDAIANGTVLPEGHGKIIDVDQFYKAFNEYLVDRKSFSFADLEAILNVFTPPVLKADKGNI